MKEKDAKLDFIKFLNVLQESEKTTQKWQKVFANHVSDQGLASECINTPYNKNKKISYLKIGKGLEQTFLQIIHRKLPKSTGTDAQVISQWRNANQNHSEAPFHPH